MLNSSIQWGNSLPGRRSENYTFLGTLSHDAYNSPEFDSYDPRCDHGDWSTSSMAESSATRHNLISRSDVVVGSSAAGALSNELPLETLHGERSYLRNLLQKEDTKAMNLLKEIEDVEKTLPDIGRGRISRRQVKKQLGWLKRMLKETTNQERTILHRLEEVTQEIRGREECMRIEEQSSHGNMHWKQLNARSRRSIPQTTHGYCYGSGHIFPNQLLINPPPVPRLSMVEAINCEYGRSPDDLPSQALLSKHRRTVSANALCSQMESRIEGEVKRLSMPTPSSPWPLEQLSGREGGQYVGYYIRS